MNNKEIETIIGIIEEAERHYILNKDEFLLKIKLEDMLKAKNNELLHDVMLRCTKDLFMYSGERIFTKGKIYKEVYPDKGSAIDDKGEEHILAEWDEFFIAI